MSKKWLAELLAIFICAGSITPLYAETIPYEKPGKQSILEIEKAYIRGEYDPFLRQLHEQCERAGKAGLLKPIYEKSKAAALKPKAVENTKNIEVERNQKLLEAIAEDSSILIAQKVDAIVFHKMPKEKQETLNLFKSMRFHVPSSAEATVENRLSALETEFYIKGLLLEIAQDKQQEESTSLPVKKIVLSFEKIERMLEVAKEQGEEKWIEKLQIYKEANRIERAFQTDLESLHRLASGKVAPKNSVEEKVQQVMIGYLEYPIDK